MAEAHAETRAGDRHLDLRAELGSVKVHFFALMGLRQLPHAGCLGVACGCSGVVFCQQVVQLGVVNGWMPRACPELL